MDIQLNLHSGVMDCRIKRLTKNRKISKILLKFHNMSNEQRQKLLEQAE